MALAIFNQLLGSIGASQPVAEPKAQTATAAKPQIGLRILDGLLNVGRSALDEYRKPAASPAISGNSQSMMLLAAAGLVAFLVIKKKI